MSVASLLVPRVYKTGVSTPSWPSWSSSGDPDGVATNTEPPVLLHSPPLHTRVVHLHAHSWLVYVRRDIILAKSNLRDFLRESLSGSAAIGRERGRDDALALAGWDDPLTMNYVERRNKLSSKTEGVSIF